MGDEYVAQLIVEELRETCPGPTGCHGCQSWCPVCGSVPNVCDDPECDAHRRETDVQADIAELDLEMRKCASECEIGERKLSKDGPPRIELRHRTYVYEWLEKEMTKLEEELREVTRPGANMVPRKKVAKSG